MPKPRNPENKGLPERWQHKHGAYYYRVPPGMESYWEGKQVFRLGNTLPDAYRVWAERLEKKEDVRTINNLLDRYALEIIPTKAPKTRTENIRQLGRLRGVFGHMLITEIKPSDIYTYHDKSKAKIAAKRELAIISHAFSMAVKWGYIDRHPFKGEVELQCNPARNRYVENWEVDECLIVQPKRAGDSIKMLHAYIKLKIITGMARSDLLRIQPARQFKEDGIHIQRHKTAESTGKRTIYEWTPALREAAQEAMDARPVDISPWLFCTRMGESYFDEKKGTCSGFDSIWQRFMARVLKETKVTMRFTEHDLRAKAGSDSNSEEDASKLLSHSNPTTTRRFYRRKPDKVRPLK